MSTPYNPPNPFDYRVDFNGNQNPTGADPVEAIAVGDLNGDGKAEIVVANPGKNTISIFQNNTDSDGIDESSFALIAPISVSLQPEAVTIGDLDGDGHNDIVVGCIGGTPTLTVLFNNGLSNGTDIQVSSFTPVHIPVGYALSSVAILSLDGGPTKVIVAATWNGLLYVEPPFTSDSPINWIYGPVDPHSDPHQWWQVAHGKLGGNGSGDDLAVASINGYISISLNKSLPGLISFQAPFDVPVGFPIKRLALADLDNDGLAELIVAGWKGGLAIFKQDHSGHFTIQSWSPSSVGYDVVVCDFDNDGYPDIIALATTVLPNIYFFRNPQGLPFPVDSVPFATAPNGPSNSLAAADLDGDGAPELIVGFNSGGLNNISILHNGVPKQVNSVIISPDPASVTVNASVGLIAQAFDQFGQPIEAIFQWSVILSTGGDQVIDNDNGHGLATYVAGSTSGTAKVRAAVGAIPGTTKISVISVPATKGWDLSGNDGVTSGNFLGTINDAPLLIKTNNAQRVQVLANEATLEVTAFGSDGDFPAATLRLNNFAVSYPYPVSESWDISFSDGRLNFTTNTNSDVALMRLAQNRNADYGPILAIVNNGQGAGTTSAIKFGVGTWDAAPTDGDAEIKAVNSTDFLSARTDLVFSAWSGANLEEIMRIQGRSGNIGIGTSNPKVRLDVLGDIQLGPDPAQRMFAPGGVEKLRLMRGTIDYDGTQVAGAGFICTKQDPGTGKYMAAHALITFDPPFSDIPSVSVTAVYNGKNGSLDEFSTNFYGNTTTTANIVWINASQMLVVTGNSDGSQRPWAFSFVAMGPQ